MDDDDKATKTKWWERTALARTVKRAKGSPGWDDDEEDKQESGPSQAAFEPLATTPGAVAVRGPGYRGDVEEDDDDGEGGEVPTVRMGGGRGGEVDEAMDAPLQVDSYAVKEGPTDEEIRQQILANTARAEMVTAVDEPKLRLYKSRMQLIVIGVVVVAAVVVGLTVPLATRSQPTETGLQGQDEDVVASVKYLEYQGSGGFAQGMRAETRRREGAWITSGTSEGIRCRPKACLESDESCVVGRTYDPGCCAGADCPNETKCGDQCPNPPESCYLKNPSNKTCIQSECYTCHQDGGTDMYNLTDYAYAIDCLEVGTAVRPENGQTYKWVIYSGPVILGPVVEENRDLGEYQCAAGRLGANYTDGHGGLGAFTYPCKFIALAECGCGPPDMYTFGLPDPTGPCVPGGGCPFLGEDAGPQHARNLCRSFPGNISWWLGKNAFNSSQFVENIMGPDYELEIYIKGVDGVN